MRNAAVALVVLAVATSAWAKKDNPEDLYPLDPDTGQYIFQDVATVEGISAGELFSRAQAWVANAYRSALDVTQLADKDAGRLIVKGLTQTSWLLETVSIRHTLTIEVKDGRYRYTLTDFVFDQGTWSKPLEDGNVGKPGRKGILRRTAADIELLLTDLRAAMSSAADDDW